MATTDLVVTHPIRLGLALNFSVFHYEVRRSSLRRRRAGRPCKLDRARSRLYRGQILQVSMRLKALAEIYTGGKRISGRTSCTTHFFAQLCNLFFDIQALTRFYIISHRFILTMSAKFRQTCLQCFPEVCNITLFKQNVSMFI